MYEYCMYTSKKGLMHFESNSLIFFSPFPPHTQKQPKLKYDTENDGATISWELTEDGTVLKKVYKFTWKVRIGRDVSSGDELDFFIDSDTGDSAIVTVTVK